MTTPEQPNQYGDPIEETQAPAQHEDVVDSGNEGAPQGQEPGEVGDGEAPIGVPGDPEPAPEDDSGDPDTLDEDDDDLADDDPEEIDDSIADDEGSDGPTTDLDTSGG